MSHPSDHWRMHQHGDVDPSISGAVNISFTYDANGNQTSGAGLTVDYTAYNKAQSVTRDSTTLTFEDGPDYPRYRQNGPAGEILYFFETRISGVRSERLAASGSPEGWTDYLMAGGALIGMHVQQSGQADETLYFNRDYLGSISEVTDSAGALLARLSYDSWGKRRNPDGTDATGSISSPTRRGYTAHEMLDAVLLIHMNGRVYDPAIARMTSADRFVTQPGDGQSWNRYAYARNNPLLYVDPSGWQAFTLPEIVVTPPVPIQPGPVGRPGAGAGPVVPSAGPGSGGLALIPGSSGSGFGSNGLSGESDWNGSIIRHGSTVRVDGVPMSLINPHPLGTSAGIDFSVKSTAYLSQMYARPLQGPVLTPSSLDVARGLQGRRLLTPAYPHPGGAVFAMGSPAYDYAAVAGLTAAGLVPFVGEAMDLAVILDPASSRWDIGIAAGSLLANVVTGGVAPNFGAAARAPRYLEQLTASAPVGRLRSPLRVLPGTNPPAMIAGRRYTGHALDRMQERGLVPSVVEDTISRGMRSPGREGATIYRSNQGRVILNPDGSVKTVMPQ